MRSSCRRRGPAGLHERSRREPQGRLFGQRVPDPRQPDGRLQPRFRHTGAARPARGCRRRRQRGHGLRPDRAPPGRRRIGVRLPPLPDRASGPHRGSPPRRAGRGPLRVPDRSDGSAGRREGLGFGAEVHPHGARRARRLRPPPPDRDPRIEFIFPCEMVVVAIGTRSNPLLTATSPDLRVNKWGYIEIDDNLQTSMPGVFAGGDIVRARPRSSWLWATARRPLRTSTPTCAASVRLPARRRSARRRQRAWPLARRTGRLGPWRGSPAPRRRGSRAPAGAGAAETAGAGTAAGTGRTAFLPIFAGGVAKQQLSLLTGRRGTGQVASTLTRDRERPPEASRAGWAGGRVALHRRVKLGNARPNRPLFVAATAGQRRLTAGRRGASRRQRPDPGSRLLTGRRPGASTTTAAAATARSTRRPRRARSPPPS